MTLQLPSPCIGVCRIDPITGQCQGCYRNRTEIAAWSTLSTTAQKQLLGELRSRRFALIGISRRSTRRQRLRDKTNTHTPQ